ncbi:SCO family protein [Streptomyces triticirhizae]|uniref:SCO family protein n=1 Tax=Streptomyces triticirhizae TaxID=2483353 RepID=A0A3M2KQ52_9ACTN|nr:SCO family protein [Streptomyces triticirhizae]RMI27599.1 SCO family protein [Streptomyces triticirhizae]
MRTRTLIRTGLVGTALTLALVGCGGDGGSAEGEESPAAEVSGAHAEDEGTVLDTPFEKPELVLTDTEGQPYDLVEETAGHATLLYFGYTNCPDICPLTMGNIAVAASELTPEQRAELRVVFVTSDPERDTPESLGPWLDSLDPDFVGLTGDFDTIQAAARSVGVALEPSYEEEDGSVVSTHGTQVVAFSPHDDLGHVLYTEGVTVETFERDLPRLIEGELP